VYCEGALSRKSYRPFIVPPRKADAYRSEKENEYPSHWTPIFYFLKRFLADLIAWKKKSKTKLVFLGSDVEPPITIRRVRLPVDQLECNISQISTMVVFAFKL
jgi:hypothetical protein